ncbi:MAG TPA: ABC transporter ATP-binding protein [Plantibacter sp.]|uniref:ABC transporter ATP-binding protein n=1 Tax=Plantibacter sp. TaxID=1871045 RepID=UPI002C9B765E|nr:ABC transporter ATP-binding protein [Plantibacter sp.]
MNAIETRGLTRTFGTLDAVRGLDLDVPAGSIFALIGPNGAGKTTTIKLLMNLLQPTKGTATVLGTDVRRLGLKDWQRIGYVSENQELPEWMSPSELLDYYRPFYPTWDDALRGRLQDALGLTAAKPLRTLSRGTRMKAALLASLTFCPELVVLDEPFSGLGPLVRDELVRALLEMPGQRPWTVFVSSHDVDEVERLADWIGFMNEGRLMLAEPMDTLMKRFRQVEVVGAQGAPPPLPRVDGWELQGTVGRTLRFVDMLHTAADAEHRIISAFPGLTVRVSPMSLRDIFLTLARRGAALKETA